MLLRVSFAVLFVQDFLQRQGVAVMASSFSAAASGNAAEEEASFLAALFRECWGKCYEQLLEEKTSLFELFDPAFSASNHSAHCRRYRTARRCASSCVPGEHARFLQPFYDRNRVNELVCIDQPGEFSRHQSCLSGASAGGHSMRFFFAKCAVPLAGAGTGSAAVAGGIPSGAGAGASALLRPTRETCTSIQCALRYVPEIMRENCEQHSASPAAAREAAVLLSNIIEGWLRERIVAYDRLLKEDAEQELKATLPGQMLPDVAKAEAACAALLKVVAPFMNDERKAEIAELPARLRRQQAVPLALLLDDLLERCEACNREAETVDVVEEECIYDFLRGHGFPMGNSHENMQLAARRIASSSDDGDSSA